MSNTFLLSDILEKERQRLEQKKTNIDTTLAAQGRLMTLNDSYRKRYSRYTQMIAIFVFAVIAFLLVSALPRVAPFIPRFLIDIMSFFIVLIAAFKMFFLFTEIQGRSNTNYDELDIPPSVDLSGNLTSIDIGQTEKSEYNIGDIATLLSSYGISTCFGGDCCPDGYIYDKVTNKCVEAVSNAPAPAAPATATPPAPRQAFTLLSEAEDKSELDSHTLGTPAPYGQMFSTEGEKYVERRFIAPPLQ